MLWCGGLTSALGQLCSCSPSSVGPGGQKMANKFVHQDKDRETESFGMRNLLELLKCLTLMRRNHQVLL